MMELIEEWEYLFAIVICTLFNGGTYYLMYLMLT